MTFWDGMRVPAPDKGSLTPERERDRLPLPFCHVDIITLRGEVELWESRHTDT